MAKTPRRVPRSVEASSGNGPDLSTSRSGKIRQGSESNRGSRLNKKTRCDFNRPGAKAELRAGRAVRTKEKTARTTETSSSPSQQPNTLEEKAKKVSHGKEKNHRTWTRSPPAQYCRGEGEASQTESRLGHPVPQLYNHERKRDDMRTVNKKTAAAATDAAEQSEIRRRGTSQGGEGRRSRVEGAKRGCSSVKVYESKSATTTLFMLTGTLGKVEQPREVRRRYRSRKGNSHRASRGGCIIAGAGRRLIERKRER